MMRILLTGASGFLGSEIVDQAKRLDLQLVAFSRRQQEVAYPGQFITSSTDPGPAQAVLRQQPDVCIHCAAIADIAYCQANWASSYNVNVGLTEKLSQACQKTGTKLVFISTDYVFEGRNSPYTESDRRNPIQSYGLTKAIAERRIEQNARSLTIRLPLLYSTIAATPSHANRWPYSALGQTPTRVDNMYRRQPCSVDDAATAILYCSTTELTGILHVAPLQTGTKYELASRVASKLQLPFPIPTVDNYKLTSHVPRPLRSELDSTRANSLGVPRPRTFSERLPEIVKAMSTLLS